MQELDVRTIPPKRKHLAIHEMLAALGVDATLRIVSDHDARPLRFELDANYPGTFVWSYVERGPDVWRMDIHKVAEMPTPAPVDAPPRPSLTDLDPVVLDVRPFHERGEEPFAAIMGAVEALSPEGALLLINSFEPTPLFRVMERKGFSASCRAIAPDEFHILFTRNS